eukprot:7385046-Prymnesium_polylepis.1
MGFDEGVESARAPSATQQHKQAKEAKHFVRTCSGYSCKRSVATGKVTWATYCPGYSGTRHFHPRSCAFDCHTMGAHPRCVRSDFYVRPAPRGHRALS